MMERQIAYKVCIKELLEGNFAKNTETEVSTLSTGTKSISRANIIGTVLECYEKELMLDDGTGKIIVRSFDDKLSFQPGNAVLVIGKIREFGNERYLACEICKKLDNPLWIRLRKKELEKTGIIPEGQKISPENAEKSRNTTEAIYGLIKQMDNGDGADYEMVIKNSGIDGAEPIIKELLKNGDVYEIRPGKLKSLD